MARYDSFMVRVWRSTVAGCEQWSGRLEHLQQGQSWEFDTLDGLCLQLRRLADSDRAASPAGPKAGRDGAADGEPGLPDMSR